MFIIEIAEFSFEIAKFAAKIATFLFEIPTYEVATYAFKNATYMCLESRRLHSKLRISVWNCHVEIAMFLFEGATFAFKITKLVFKSLVA